MDPRITSRERQADLAGLRVLVTGGNGFLGALLVHKLTSSGALVHLFLRAGSDRSRLRGIAAGYEVHDVDLRDARGVKSAAHSASPQVIFHLAAHGVSPAGDGIEAVNTNVIGTSVLLEALNDHPYESFVHVGSGAEYGEQPCPIREDAWLTPRTAYGITKAAASVLCRAYAGKGRPLTIVRVFSAYGPGENPSRLVPYVLSCAMRGAAPRLSAGQQVRDYVFADDVVELLIRASTSPAAAGKVLHAATGRGVSVREVVELAMSVAGGGHAEFGAAAMRPGEPRICYASIEETTRLTGWRPQTDLFTGLTRVKEWIVRDGLVRAA